MYGSEDSCVAIIKILVSDNRLASFPGSCVWPHEPGNKATSGGKRMQDIP